MSTLAIEQDKYPEAEQLLLQSIDIFDKNNIDNDPVYILTLANLGELYLRMLNKAKALEYLNRALKLYEVTVGKSSSKYKEVEEKIQKVDLCIQIYSQPNWKELVAQQQVQQPQQQQQQKQQKGQKQGKKNNQNVQNNKNDEESSEDFGTQLWNLIVE